MVKIPVPFLAITALKCGTTDPLEIIIAIKTATKDFNGTHKNATDFEYKDMQASTEDFANWLFAVHMNFIKETRLTAVEPGNIEITKHSKEGYDCNCILPPIDALGHIAFWLGRKSVYLKYHFAAKARHSDRRPAFGTFPLWLGNDER
jgi:hypothetical protein